MILGSPLFLLALLSLPILWWLAMSRRRRREAPVASLLVWRRLSLAPEPPRRSARRADRFLLLRLAIATLLTLGLCGPGVVRKAGAPVLRVLVDDSPSMRAFGPSVENALAAVRTAAPSGARVEVRRSPGLADLSSLLATGKGNVVAVTDHVPAGFARGGRVRLALVGEPVQNVGFVSAWIEKKDGEDRYGAVVRSFATVSRTLKVRGPGGEQKLFLAPGASRLLCGPAPKGRAELTILPGDRFAFDDHVVVERVPGREVRLAWHGPAAPRLRLALTVGGIRFDPRAKANLAYRTAPGARTSLSVAPPGPRREADPAGPFGGPDLPPDAVPPPGVSLGPVAVLRRVGTVLLGDAGGPLAVRNGDRITVAVDPGDPACQWALDPSFPIFFSVVARELGARRPASRVVGGLVDPAESATKPVSAPLALGDLRPDRPAGERPPLSLSPLLYLLAAAGLVLHLVLGGSR